MRINILGIPVDSVTFEQAVGQITALTEHGQCHQIVTVNPEMIVEAQRNQAFREVLVQADLLVPDGVGLLSMAQFLADTRGKPQNFVLVFTLLKYLLWTLSNRQKFTALPERVSGADLVVALSGKAEALGVPVVLIGGDAGDGWNAGKRLRERFPNLKVIVNAGPKDASLETTIEWQQVSGQLSVSCAFVFVAFGHPKQELWIAKHKSALPAGIAMGVGGTFAYLAGSKRRAHPFLQSLGLEWLWRFISEPRRWRRIINATIVFPWLIYRDRIRNKHSFSMNNE